MSSLKIIFPNENMFKGAVYAILGISVFGKNFTAILTFIRGTAS